MLFLLVLQFHAETECTSCLWTLPNDLRKGSLGNEEIWQKCLKIEQNQL